MDRRKAIRIRAQDLAGLRPVSRYDRVVYPTRTEARALGIDLYRVPDSLLRRYGRKALTGATILMLSSTASCQGVIATKCDEISFMHEADAREIIVARMVEEGIAFEPDYQYVSGSMEMNLDGYDPESGIGYDYHSIEDWDECKRECCGEEWESAYADWEEQSALQLGVHSEGADAINFFDPVDGGPGPVSTRDALERQVEAFIEMLVFHGRL